KTNRALFGEPVEAVVGHFGLDRFLAFSAPRRQQALKRRGIEYEARQHERATLAAFLHHDNGYIATDLLEADRGRQPCGPATDDSDVEFHCLPRGEISHGQPPALPTYH